MTISGAVFVPNVEMPRIQKLAPSAPGSPVRCVAITPAILPANEEVRLLEGKSRLEGFTACTAPTTLSFFWMPNPTTTTSSIELACSFRLTSFISWMSLTRMRLVS